MNIAAYSQTSYTQSANNSIFGTLYARKAKNNENQSARNEELRQSIRTLNREGTGSSGASSDNNLNYLNELLGIAGDSEEAADIRQILDAVKQDELTNYSGRSGNISFSFESISNFFEKALDRKEGTGEVSYKSTKYNYKEVETKIRQAKTSVSAGQAVRSAKKKVMDVKRQISKGDGDAEELQLALTHAKRMEMAARKKKHHLELEELVENTRKMDEKLEKFEDAADSQKNGPGRLGYSFVDMKEEEITKQEDKIFEEREAMLEETLESFEDSGVTLSDEMMTGLNEFISEFGEDELEALEEAMEFLEDLEVIDPHMSEEGFEELKRKHRASEDKAMLKADMDYLKGMVKLQQERGSNTISANASFGGMTGVAFASQGVAAIAGGVDAVCGGSFDVAL